LHEAANAEVRRTSPLFLHFLSFSFVLSLFGGRGLLNTTLECDC
jgi:hypothetical protein